MKEEAGFDRIGTTDDERPAPNLLVFADGPLIGHVP